MRFDRVKDLKAAKAEYDEFLKISQADSPLYRSCGWSLFKTYDSIYLTEVLFSSVYYSEFGKILFGSPCHCADCAKYDLKLKSLKTQLADLRREHGDRAAGERVLLDEIDKWKIRRKFHTDVADGLRSYDKTLRYELLVLTCFFLNC